MVGEKRGYDDFVATARALQQPNSWPDLWSTVLGTDGDAFDNDSSDLLLRDNVGQDIEDWASSAFFDLHLEPGLPSANSIDAQSRPICYGAIENVAVKLHGDMSTLLNAVDQTLSIGHLALDMQKQYGHYMLSVGNDIVFGQVSDKIEHGLESLAKHVNVTFAAFAPSAPLKDFLRRSRKSSNPITKITINLYGARTDATLAGRILSTAKLYLQDPDYGLENIDYINPHILEYPDYPIPRTLDNDLALESLASLDSADDPLRSTMTEVYNSARRDQGLERMLGNAAITTPLKPHQEQALQFMFQRERGPILDEYSLWRPIGSQETQVFKHKITGDEYSERPHELGGGILSDDMGMGKTLSALALITQTLDEAAVWAAAPAKYTNGRPRSRATLVVSPSGQILNEWLKEIRKHLDHSVTAATYHGRRRDGQKKQLTQSHIVLTTYHTLASSEKNDQGLAQNMEWYRIVLDEAHVIRRHATKLFQSASKLEAQYRWCLTGTPIQNALEDFGSLLAFARIEPFQNVSVFRKYVVRPISERYGEARTVGIQNFALLLDAVSLRRYQSLLNLPDVTEKRVLVEFTAAERQQYQDTMAAMSKLIKEQAHQKQNNRNILNLFQAQLQLRILCNHGTYQRCFVDKHSLDARIEQEEAMISLGGQVEFQCSSCGIVLPILETSQSESQRRGLLCTICSAPSADQQTPSSLSPCMSSSSSWTKRSKTSSVDTTSPSATSASTTRSPSFGSPVPGAIRVDRQKYFQSSGVSSKIQHLVADLFELPSDTKCIVFSCWTRSLDLVAIHLGRLKLAFMRIDGDCYLKERQATLEEFSQDGDTKMLLMSRGVGALGLNLTAASHIFILEPQWNPSTEQQAIGRASRIGQTKPVFVTRYLVKETLEMIMCSQQRRKRDLARIGTANVDLTDKKAFQLT